MTYQEQINVWSPERLMGRQFRLRWRRGLRPAYMPTSLVFESATRVGRSLRLKQVGEQDSFLLLLSDLQYLLPIGQPKGWMWWVIPSMARSPRHSKMHYTEDGKTTLCGRYDLPPHTEAVTGGRPQSLTCKGCQAKYDAAWEARKAAMRAASA